MFVSTSIHVAANGTKKHKISNILKIITRVLWYVHKLDALGSC